MYNILPSLVKCSEIKFVFAQFMLSCHTKVLKFHIMLCQVQIACVLHNCAMQGIIGDAKSRYTLFYFTLHLFKNLLKLQFVIALQF